MIRNATLAHGAINKIHGFESMPPSEAVRVCNILKDILKNGGTKKRKTKKVTKKKMKKKKKKEKDKNKKGSKKTIVEEEEDEEEVVRERKRERESEGVGDAKKESMPLILASSIARRSTHSDRR